MTHGLTSCVLCPSAQQLAEGKRSRTITHRDLSKPARSAGSLKPQRLQSCLRNVQGERSHVSQVPPSLTHETASPSSAPWQEAARAAAPEPREQRQPQHCCTSTALWALRVSTAAHLSPAAALCPGLVTAIPFLSLWPR